MSGLNPRIVFNYAGDGAAVIPNILGSLMTERLLTIVDLPLETQQDIEAGAARIYQDRVIELVGWKKLDN